MMSNDKSKYESPSQWLSILKGDESWHSQLLQLQDPKADMSVQREKAMRRIGTGLAFEYWDIYQHQVEPAVMEVWERLTLDILKIQAIGMLSMEWMEEKKKKAAGTSVRVPDEPNVFAPKKNLQELLRQPWFAEVRTHTKYDATWTDGFVEALMASEYGMEIASQWAVPNKRNQQKGYVVGLLKDAGVLKGSYDSIAKIMITDNARTFSSYMGRGKKQPYAEWVKRYVFWN